jgi:twinkle protein
LAFVKFHLPCPECGGSDPVSVDEKGNGYCFSCNTFLRDYEGGETITSKITDFKTYKRNTMNYSDGSFSALSDRNITLDTVKKYGVKSISDSSNKTVTHFYPYYNGNEMGGAKVRDVETKNFVWEGSPKGTGLFGQQAFQAGGKYITLVEGECDAMAAYELLGSKWPVVSVKNGAGGAVKDVKENLEFLESFDCVVINFDNDKAGKEAAKKVARVLRPGKSKILNLPEEYKDCNDMLKQNSKHAYVTCWWAAKLYTPSGIINVSEMGDSYFNRETQESVPYPWDGLNEKLYGMRRGELVTLTGGTGLGKSSITREIEHFLIRNTEDRVGILALEENKNRTVDGIVSIEANAKLYINQIREEFPEEDWRKHYESLFKGDAKDRLWIYSHLGQHDIEEIFSKLRYLAMGCDCKWIVVDHLHMLVSTLAEGDERRAIDNIMTRLRSLVEETGVGMILVSHLRRVEGNKGHEQGVTVSISHLRGSQSIAQLSDCVIALERNQQSDDSIEANTTHVRVLKSRYTGDVGMATHLLYDNETGRLSEITSDDSDEFYNEEDGIPF